MFEEKVSDKRHTKKKLHEIPFVSFLFRLRNVTKISPKAWRIIALVLLVVSSGSIWFGLKNKPSADSNPVIRYDVSIEDNLAYSGRKSLAISHNGEYLVYVTNQGLYLKLFNSEKPAELIPNISGCRYPIFSSDDKWIAYEKISGNEIMKISLQGGYPVHLTDLGSGIKG